MHRVLHDVDEHIEHAVDEAHYERDEEHAPDPLVFLQIFVEGGVHVVAVHDADRWGGWGRRGGGG